MEFIKNIVKYNMAAVILTIFLILNAIGVVFSPLLK